MECVVEGSKEYMLLGFFPGMVEECALEYLASPVGKLSRSLLDSSSSGNTDVGEVLVKSRPLALFPKLLQVMPRFVNIPAMFHVQFLTVT